MGFGKRLQVIHSLPCTNSPVIHPPHQHLFIQQIPSFDLFAKYIEHKFECRFFRCNFCKYLLFFLISRQHQTKLLSFSNVPVSVGASRVWGAVGRGVAGLPGARGHTPPFTLANPRLTFCQALL